MSEQTVTVKDATALAVRYASFLRASDGLDLTGIIVWGNMLLDSQDITGVELCEDSVLRLMIARAASE